MPNVQPKAPVVEDTIVQKGIKLVKQKKYEEAINIFTKVIEREKTSSEMLLWISRAYSFSADELKKLAELRDAGVITEEDFLEFKKKLLSK